MNTAPLSPVWRRTAQALNGARALNGLGAGEFMLWESFVPGRAAHCKLPAWRNVIWQISRVSKPVAPQASSLRPSP